MNNSTLDIHNNQHFSAFNVEPDLRGILATITASTTGTLDFPLSDDCYVTGSKLIVNNGSFGDKISVQLIDKDNVLGLGENTILGQFVTDWYVESGSQSVVDFPYTSKIVAGLYLRTVYTSVGESNVGVAMNFITHKALY